MVAGTPGVLSSFPTMDQDGHCQQERKIEKYFKEYVQAIGDDHLIIPSSPTPRRSFLFVLSALKNLFAWTVL